jgi:ABC-2 type transport system permease protein
VPLETAVRPDKRSSFYWFVSNHWELVKRSLRHIKHDPDQLVTVTVQPVLLVLLFRYFCCGAIRIGGPESYINFLMAGIFIETATISATTTATSVSADMARGVVDRFRSLPMARSAVLGGHVIADLARSAVGIVVMVGVGLAVGFRPSAGAGSWVIAISLTLLVTFALSWVAAVIGLLGRSVEAVQQLAMLMILPIFASNAFVPVTSMPGWVQEVAANAPLTQAIDAVRALLLGTPVGSHLVLAVAWFGGIVAVAFVAATTLVNRRVGMTRQSGH